MLHDNKNTEEDSVDDLRQKGNHEFKKGNLEHAILLYSAAIERPKTITTTNEEEDVQRQLHIVNLCNRSACYYQLEQYEQAQQDALEAWDASNHSNVKAAYRLSKTWMAMEDYTSAMEVLQMALLGGTISELQANEQQSLEELLAQAKIKQLQQQQNANQPLPIVETTIKGANRLLSIREFSVTQTLGVGNFSEICIAQHRVTREFFALKKLEKKQATDLAKRQHPNVHNEIAMEARVLLERLPPHYHVVNMYHAFQDYNTLYYLMDLHHVNLDLWSQIRYKNNMMVGCKPSQIKRWTMQLIAALEHLHSHGIVHRDLKPENILLNEKNHVVVIDFGTAKDLVRPDLNGPEFVGTPDFMSPEAVTGFSGMPKADDSIIAAGATHTADLWALGAVISLLHTGSTPFWSPSPYLAFLKIKRGLLTRPWGIPDDDAFDLISQLMTVNPSRRLGHDCYKVENTTVVINKGYDVIRNHPYFNTIQDQDQTHVIPSLHDLCLFACSEMAQRDVLDLDLCDQHPPGDGSARDLTRLSESQRRHILHILDKAKVFKDGDETRVLQRFFATPVAFLQSKVRPQSRDFCGLTQMTDDEYKPQSQRGSADPYAKKDKPEATNMVVLSNPLLLLRNDESLLLLSEEEEKKAFKGLKACIAAINKQRPKIVIVPAQQTMLPKVWKLLARIRDSIPVLWTDGSVHYTFWLNGFQGILLQRSELLDPNSTQNVWLHEQMEQSRMAKPQLFCFCDCDPRDLPPMVLKQLARGRVLCLMGLVGPSSSGEDVMLDYPLSYEPNETLDDGASVKSTDSQEDEDDAYTMRVLATSLNGMGWLTVHESEQWTTTFEPIPLPE